MEMTSATKLPRRIFTFSRENVEDAIRHNRANGEMYLSVNFANYINDKLTGHRGRSTSGDVVLAELDQWLQENLGGHRQGLRFIGTGAKTDDMIQLP